MLDDRDRELVLLLRRAEAALRNLDPASIGSSYESGPAMADFIAAACVELESQTVTETTSSELWGIFAPTCDWDDTVGDVDLGNAIFEILDGLYGPRTQANA